MNKPTPLRLLEKEVHIWSLIPGSVREKDILDHCLSVLSKAELQQYRRFLAPGDRHRYLVSHAMVRQLLSRYVDIPPSAWVFETSARGRPEIANPGIPPVRFNLTHTSGFAACVISLGGLCGIDAERTSRQHNVCAIAKRMFSKEEYDQVCASRGQAQLDYFYTRWTLREAYVKAVGIGISFPTRKLTFTVNARNDIEIAFDPVIEDDPADWRLELFYPTDSHVVAAALGGQELQDRDIVSRNFQFE